MTNFDFHAAAQLYLGSNPQVAAEQGHRTFRTAAQALCFAIEEAAPVSLRGASLVIGDRTYDRDAMLRLYRSPDYPLPRKAAVLGARPERARRSRLSRILPAVYARASAPALMSAGAR